MISIIIPFHNRKNLLTRLFNSLRKIKETDVELIFVDNGSEIETKECVDAFVTETNQSNTRVKAIVVEEPRPGSTIARNKGLDIASGDYVYFFDSDDELSPEMIFRAEHLAETSDADVVVVQTQLVLSDDKIIKKNLVRSTNPKFQIIANNFATQSLFLKRDFAHKNARWNETLFYWNDLEWGLRIMLAEPTIAWLDGAYHKIYKHNDSITGKSFTDSIDKIIKAHDVMKTDICECKLKESVKKRLLTYLNCRKALYAGHIFRESGKDNAQRILSTITLSETSPFARLKIKLLYLLSKKGVPGIWRLV